MPSDILKAVEQHRIIAIFRGIAPELAVATAQALYEGGIRMVEVTFNQRSATKFEDTAGAIKAIAAKLDGKLLVGAGTVLTVEEAKAAKNAGATYALSPDMNPAVISAVKEMGMASIPGAMTPTEIAAAWDAGADLVKLFPAGGLGTGYLKDVSAPLSHIPLIAVGGIDLSNLAAFLNAGAKGLGIGSSITNMGLINNGEFAKLADLAREYTEIAKK